MQLSFPSVGRGQASIAVLFLDALNLQSLEFKKEIDMLGIFRGGSTKMVKGLETESCEEWLRELGMFSLQKRRQSGDMITILKHLRAVMWKMEQACYLQLQRIELEPVDSNDKKGDSK